MSSEFDIPPVISAWNRRPPGPVESAERLVTLDVLRGFALFGILLVNMALFGWPVYHLWGAGQIWTSRVDIVADHTVRFLAEGKFYPLFSFLFGLGMALQMERAEARGASFGPIFCRRLLVLLSFGLIHAFAIWEGDILVWYALFGFLLLAFRKRRPRTLLVWAVVCVCIPLSVFVALWGLFAVGSLVPEIAEQLEQYVAEAGATSAALGQQNIDAFRQGGIGEIFSQRARNVLFIWQVSWFYAPAFFAMFLLGLYAGQRQIFRHLELHRPLMRRILAYGLCVGLPCNLVYVVGFSTGNLMWIDLVFVVTLFALLVGGPALSLAYISGLTLLLQNERGRRALTPLAAAGRMALTNYLLQSLICTTIFYSYGLGWYGSVGRAAGLGLVALIFPAQVVWSVWWMKRFRFGPVEWLWRTLTYGRRPPMRVEKSSASESGA